MIVSPSSTGVDSPSANRMLFSPTNTLTCSRTVPCSVTTRSNTPGQCLPTADSASWTVVQGSSMRSVLLPRAYGYKARGRTTAMDIVGCWATRRLGFANYATLAADVPAPTTAARTHTTGGNALAMFRQLSPESAEP